MAFMKPFLLLLSGKKSNRFLKECGIPKAILVTSTTVHTATIELMMIIVLREGFLQCLNSHLLEVINKSCYHSLPAVRFLWTKDGL